MYDNTQFESKEKKTRILNGSDDCAFGILHNITSLVAADDCNIYL